MSSTAVVALSCVVVSGEYAAIKMLGSTSGILLEQIHVTEKSLLFDINLLVYAAPL